MEVPVLQRYSPFCSREASMTERALAGMSLYSSTGDRKYLNAAERRRFLKAARLPPHLVQRWLGHASLRTTSIYGDVIGPEERAFAARMWK
jgi:integrase